MAKLYNRIAQLNINGRQFDYPPFSIAFDQTVAIGVPSSTSVRLYNPAPDTIKAAEAIKQGSSYEYPRIVIEAGYVENYGTCVLGEISDYKVKTSGPDKILEMKISDKTKDWANAIINKTWVNTRASVIIGSMLEQVGIELSSIGLGTDKLYNKLTVSYLREGLNKIVKDTNSEYNFINGIIEINPKVPSLKKVIKLSYKNGLIGKPEKTQGGIKFKTLFLYQLNSGSFVNISITDINNNFKIKKGKKKFSTFGKAECEFEAIEV
jgi:hypothetical protein